MGWGSESACICGWVSCECVALAQRDTRGCLSHLLRPTLTLVVLGRHEGGVQNWKEGKGDDHEGGDSVA